MQFVAKKKGDIKHSQADITIAKNHLGYSPKFELKEMIKELLNK
jgi:nucleoside-diphosphate-sugar epimerase